MHFIVGKESRMDNLVNWGTHTLFKDSDEKNAFIIIAYFSTV